MDIIPEFCGSGKSQNENKLALLNFAALSASLFPVSTVAEIESAISALPVQDARSVAGWLQDYLDAKWNKQMDEDIASGRLDPLWEKAKADIAAGRVKPLDEVLNDE
jgi:hypothetical protein